MKARLNMMCAIVCTLLLIVMTACGTAPTASSQAAEVPTSLLGREQATEIAENALRALNGGEYSAYTRDWTELMKSSITEKDFLSWRDQVMKTAGKYQSISDVQLTAAKTPGHVRWVFTCAFERARARYSLTFKQDGNQIEGVHLEPIS